MSVSPSRHYAGYVIPVDQDVDSVGITSRKRYMMTNLLFEKDGTHAVVHDTEYRETQERSHQLSVLLPRTTDISPLGFRFHGVRMDEFVTCKTGQQQLLNFCGYTKVCAKGVQSSLAVLWIEVIRCPFIVTVKKDG
jgi:hypothetical protein